MEKLFFYLQKLSKTFFGLNLMKNFPKIKIQVFKSILLIMILINNISLSVYGAFFDSNIKMQAKFQLLCIISAASLFLMLFIGLWHNESQYQHFSNWIRARYSPRSFKLIDDVSKVEYGVLSTQVSKIVK